MAGWIDGSSSILVSSLGSNNRRSVSRDNSSISKSLHLGNMLRLMDGSRPFVGWIDGPSSILVSSLGSSDRRSVNRDNSSIRKSLHLGNMLRLMDGSMPVAGRIDGSRAMAGWIDGPASILVSLFGSCNSRSVSRYNSSISKSMQSGNTAGGIDGTTS